MKALSTKVLSLWFGAVSIVLVCWGIVFSTFGLGVLPVAREVLGPWTSGLYGAIMIGWGVTLLLVGRVAFRRGDGDLVRALLIGLGLWLVVEAAVSIYFAVWFNVGVDVAVLALFAFPLVSQVSRRHA